MLDISYYFLVIMLPNTCLKMRNEVNAEKVLEFKKKRFVAIH